jgi:hypothetical protein
MRTEVMLLSAGVMSALLSTTAFAGLPAWCKGYDSGQGEYGIFKNSLQNDDRSNVELTLNWSCSTASGERDKQQADIQAAKADISKRLFMNDADWSEAVEYVKENGSQKMSDDIKVSGATFAAFTPIDQYLAIRKETNGFDSLYLADALESNLSEMGRLGFLASCTKSDMAGNPEPVYWAVCLGDLAKFDPNKAAAEIRADKAHPAWSHTAIHIALGSIVSDLHALGDKGKEMAKKDEGYQKLFDAAAKGRAEFEKTLMPAQKDVLALVTQLDSAVYFHSRKQYAGCEEKVWQVLSNAASKIPASRFKGMHDDPQDPVGGFATSAGPVLANDPAMNLAMTAYSLCLKDAALSYWFTSYLQDVPGYRGPRSAAWQALFAQHFELDDTDAKEIRMTHPEYSQRPYGRTHGGVRSAGGIVASIKPGKDKEIVTVTHPKSSVRTEDCVKWHSTNKIVDFDTAGRPVYESFCDKSAMRTHDTTPGDDLVTSSTAKWLKPGVLYTSVAGDKAFDVVAVWPSKTAKLPSLLFGANIK